MKQENCRMHRFNLYKNPPKEFSFLYEKSYKFALSFKNLLVISILNIILLGLMKIDQKSCIIYSFALFITIGNSIFAPFLA